MSFSDIIFVAAGAFALAASIVVYAFAKNSERRRADRAAVAVDDEASR